MQDDLFVDPKETESQALRAKRDSFLEEVRQLNQRIHDLSGKTTKYPIFITPTGDLTTELMIPDYGMCGMRHHPTGMFVPVNLNLLTRALDLLRLHD